MTGFSKKVVITGGLGYVGGRLANHLTVAAPELSLRLLTRRAKESLPGWARKFDVLQTPLLEQAGLAEAVEGADTVIHLAAANEIICQRDPELAMEINATGTLRLLEACREKGVGRFIYMSTFHVYGATSSAVITEEMATSPTHPYAITHRVAEDFVNAYRVNHGMATLSLRLSNGYGYPADPDIDRWTLVFGECTIS
jgi:UDP-glucose 4-epimerase